jgi:hypothetical protein
VIAVFLAEDYQHDKTKGIVRMPLFSWLSATIDPIVVEQAHQIPDRWPVDWNIRIGTILHRVRRVVAAST